MLQRIGDGSEHQADDDRKRDRRQNELAERHRHAEGDGRDNEEGDLGRVVENML